jgi:hypothetical protein
MSYFYSKAAAGGSFPAANLLHCECDDNSGATATSATGPNLGLGTGVGWSAVGGGVSLDIPGTETGVVTAASNLTYGTVNTVSLWAYQDSAGFPSFYSGATQNAANSFSFFDDGGMHIWLVGSSAANALKIDGFDLPSTGAWHHFVFVFDSAVDTGSFYGDVTAYVDGSEQVLDSPTLDAKDNANAPTAATPVFGQWFNGQLDDVRIWNSGLTSGEVAALYAAGRQ